MNGGAPLIAGAPLVRIGRQTRPVVSFSPLGGLKSTRYE